MTWIRGGQVTGFLSDRNSRPRHCLVHDSTVSMGTASNRILLSQGHRGRMQSCRVGQYYCNGWEPHNSRIDAEIQMILYLRNGRPLY